MGLCVILFFCHQKFVCVLNWEKRGFCFSYNKITLGLEVFILIIFFCGTEACRSGSKKLVIPCRREVH